MPPSSRPLTFTRPTDRSVARPGWIALLAAGLAGTVAASETPAPKADAKLPPKAAAAAAKPAPADNLDRLRERLAEKLGASKPADAGGANLLRVSTRADAPAEPAAGHAATAPRRLAIAPPTAAPARAAKPAAEGHGHWAYGGESGPAAWGGLRPEFATCGTGQRQSPIDIRGGIAVDLEPVFFDYKASGFGVIDNGHTVQVNLAAGNQMQVSGRRFELVQFHFHRPSETRINGRQFDMEVHLVHRDADGKLAVVAIPIERGTPQPVVQAVWNNLPLEKGEEQSAGAVLDLNHLLPPDRGYYTFMGSLTTPPCSEGVLWMVMRQPVPVSQQQLDIFARLYPMNARPVQALAGRLIKQSQ